MRLNPHFGLLPLRAFRVLGGRMTLEGGGKDSSPPPSPDYRGAAQEQAQSSKEVTNIQTYANRPNQTTPWGGTTWTTSAGTDPGTGQAITQWNQNLNLTPESQHALDSQLQMQSGRSDLANSTMDRVRNDVKDPFEFSGFNPRQGAGMARTTLDTHSPTPTTTGTDPNMFSADRKRFEQEAFDRMRPEHDFQQRGLDTQLVNKGLTPGSEAYNREKMLLQDNQARERFNATAAGGQEQARMQASLLAQNQQAFGQDVTAQQAGNQADVAQQGTDITGANFQNNLRQQEIAEEAQRRGISLNEMNAIMTGQQVQTPQMPGFIGAGSAQPVQALTAANMQNQSALDVWNAQQANSQGMMSGLFGLGGSVLGGIYGGPAGAAIGGQAGRLFG